MRRRVVQCAVCERELLPGEQYEVRYGLYLCKRHFNMWMAEDPKTLPEEPEHVDQLSFFAAEQPQ